jgi:DNA ligase-associated metallophosphoesterase
MRIELAGEQVELRPEAAVYWPKMAVLFVADCHLGKAETFRRFGVPIPDVANTDTLQRLTTLIQSTAAERLVILGDFWHHPVGMTTAIHANLRRWLHDHRALSIDLILGNHDSGHPHDEYRNRIAVHTESLRLGPFSAHHMPKENDETYCLAGHLHPSYRLSGKARQSLSLPCFWLGPRLGILPAFGSFTGRTAIVPNPDDRVYVIADDRVFPITTRTSPTE